MVNIVQKIDKRIEIVSSSITRLSSMSLQSRIAVLKVLKRHFSDVRITLIDNLGDLEDLADRNPDLVFLGMKYLPVPHDSDRNRIWVAKYLKARGIACTGSSDLAHRLELDKQLAKQCVLEAGLQTSPYYVVSQSQPALRANSPINFPLFVKPTNLGGGQGVDSFSVAHNFEQLDSKVLSIATNFYSDSLVEQYLPGREFSVAILKDERSGDYLAMPIELVAPVNKNGQRFLSSKVKSADSETFLAVVEPHIKASVSALALSVFHAMGAQDYGRIDIRLDAFGTPNFLEANLIPSLIRDYGNFPKACQLNIGMSYEDMILTITRLGFARAATVEEYLLSSEQLH